ncbi:MAG: histidine phosphatase family protein [Gammaproteobacteria bacterium]|nr:histidine phosphatase family protein [Gammaproteobacteria bacterium]MDH5653343.1 histidine phosphatase family protein [Gammaproteobacteria bacterium]
MTDTLIDLIRHGQPQGGSVYRGHGIDDPLSELGWQQMWQAVADATPWQHIITSPMQRCRAFAERLAGIHSLPMTIDERFKEVGFGSWEGRSREAIRTENDREYDDFYRDPINCRPAGAEPIHDFISRVSTAFDAAIEQHSGKHVLIVAHAGVIRAVVAHVTHAEPRGLYRLQVKNAGMTRIRHGQYGNMLEFHNK